MFTNLISLEFLANPLFANLMTYFGQSNWAGKLVVICLMIFSILAWTIMLGKAMDLKRLRRLNQAFERHLGQGVAVLGMDLSASRRGRGPYARLASEALDAYYRARSAYKSEGSMFSHVENALQRGISDICVQYESKMVLLASIVSGAPFLGLLGTVWGVMDAFGSIAQTGGGSIQTLAPGVSGALLTTVAGLLVAIPSVFGYNFLLQQTKLMVTELENFASTLADQIELEAKEEE